jgi:hypothetical protein
MGRGQPESSRVVVWIWNVTVARVPQTQMRTVFLAFYATDPTGRYSLSSEGSISIRTMSAADIYIVTNKTEDVLCCCWSLRAEAMGMNCGPQTT